ncbi:bifunctional 2-polyprenyl-6-hydroxyphenol methylase/3-demethylubiquinol 3-O-methyltransferase UbiG [Butyrivibrio sp. INlla16]|uniref:class I SAM-dependent methyltransferase n=1 Tax=Butyrivibrio sp. INlla16 TaxID=1520807 RepID=UPI001FA801A5|nr:class I SAM-dependent methyltransferase [Butyrivibrio sp. INlla16]
MNDKVSKWYENTKNVDEMLDWRPALKEWEKSVSKLFSPGSRILDIGCGLGREAFALHDLGFEVVGIDISNYLGTNSRIVVWRRVEEQISVGMQKSS